MSKYVKILLIVVISIFFVQTAKSQNDTTFNTQIIFNGESRTLSVHVPKLTNGAEKYKLFIWLHGLGDNSSNFLNVIVQSGVMSFLENTIIAAPDGGNDQNKDFYSPEGDEEFIRISEDWVKSYYAVDTNYIYLGGFSLGGRSALKYGLDHPDAFRGLLLNTPAMQGLKDVDGLINLQFNYENANQISIAITHGADDIIYVNPIDTMYKRLVEHNCKTIKYLVLNMAHQIPGANILKPCFEFLDNPLKNNLDAELFDIIYPNFNSLIYTETIKPIIRIRNTGATPINSLDINYLVNNTPYSYKWQNESYPIESFHYADIELPELNIEQGVSEITATISLINEQTPDSLLSPKTENMLFIANLNSLPLPFKYGFEIDDPNFYLWQVIPSGNLFTWGMDSTVRTEGVNSESMFNTPFLFDNLGTSEYLYSPLLNLTTVNHPILSFDLAFNYLLFTPPYTAQNLPLTDTLRIYVINTEYSGTPTKIYEKYGADLSTASTPITNPTSMQAGYFVPKQNEWRRETIDLFNYKNLERATFLFEYISGLGGTIYLDNLNFDDITDVNDSKIADNSLINLYPNPASDWININLPNNTKTIEIYTLEGVKLLSQDIVNYENLLKLNISQYNPGIYLIKINTGDKILNGRFVISR